MKDDDHHSEFCVASRQEWADVADGLESGKLRLTADSVPLSASRARELSEDCVCAWRDLPALMPSLINLSAEQFTEHTTDEVDG